MHIKMKLETPRYRWPCRNLKTLSVVDSDSRIRSELRVRIRWIRLLMIVNWQGQIWSFWQLVSVQVHSVMCFRMHFFQNCFSIAWVSTSQPSPVPCTVMHLLLFFNFYPPINTSWGDYVQGCWIKKWRQASNLLHINQYLHENRNDGG